MALDAAAARLLRMLAAAPRGDGVATVRARREGLRDLAALSNRDLAELQVNINTEKPHFPLLSPAIELSNWKARRASDKYGFGLSAQPGESQGRPYSH